MKNTWLAIAAVNGFLAVAFGAFGAIGPLGILRGDNRQGEGESSDCCKALKS